MSNLILYALDKLQTVKNLLKTVGPFLISQSDSASETLARHKMRIGEVEISNQLLLQEVNTLSEIKKDLLKEYIKAEPVNRLRIKRDIEEIDASLRELNIKSKALEYIDATPQIEQKSIPNPQSQQNEPEITEHWMDRFNDLARSHNEPWRENLLAKALAAESMKPGTVSPRALWILGTLEESKFNDFAMLLDLSSKIFGTKSVIPDHTTYMLKPIPQNLIKVLVV